MDGGTYSVRRPRKGLVRRVLRQASVVSEPRPVGATDKELGLLTDARAYARPQLTKAKRRKS